MDEVLNILTSHPDKVPLMLSLTANVIQWRYMCSLVGMLAEDHRSRAALMQQAVESLKARHGAVD